jgi:serine/threonine protein kinase
MSQRVFLGRFEAKRLLAEGGMGRVYLAKEYDPDRLVVVKQMREHLADDPKFRERFERETRTLARLNHPHVVKLIAASLDDASGPCLVMEYLRGIRLDELLKKNRRFAPPRAVRLMLQLCEILEALHDLQLVHRDLKPSNMMVVDPETAEEQIKLMDFGLVKIMEPSDPMSEISDPNVDFALGTPAYMSPEQARGESIDYRSDIYSVGIITYELLSGELPFVASSNMDMILAHATEQPRSFAQLGLRHWVPRALEAVVMSCLEKNAVHRPQSARELGDRFEAALARPHEEPLARTPIGKLNINSETLDPEAMIYVVEAWMPQQVALSKIRGFVHDHAGDVIESAPGLIRVRLDASSVNGVNGASALKSNGTAKHRSMDMELRLQPGPSDKPNQLRVTVLFHPPSRIILNSPEWREQSARMFCELRAFLMGRS